MKETGEGRSRPRFLRFYQKNYDSGIVAIGIACGYYLEVGCDVKWNHWGGSKITQSGPF